MKTETHLPLLELMEKSKVRTSIVENLPTFHDISSLANTCRKFDSQLQEEKIIRKMLIFANEQKVTAKLRTPFSGDIKKPALDDILFLIDPTFSRYLKFAREFKGEVFAKGNTFKIIIDNKIPYINDKDRHLIFWRITRGFCLNCSIHRYATKLTCPFNYSPYRDITLNALSYMKHNFVKSIEIDKYIFMAYFNRYKILTRNTFGGFSRLNELAITGKVLRKDYQKIVEDDRILKHVLKDLSKKENPVLVLKNYYPSHDIFLDYISMILEITNKLNIKVKAENRGLMFGTKKSNGDKLGSEYSTKYSQVRDHITLLHNRIQNIKHFCSIIPAIKHFSKLEHLVLLFDCFDFKKDLEKMNIKDPACLAIKECEKLTNLTLYFGRQIDPKEDTSIENYKENMKLFASLMPTSIERINIITLRPFTKEIAEAINEHLPNIKILTFSSALPDEINFCGVFDKLEVLICYAKPPTEIPSTVKLFAIMYERVSSAAHRPFRNREVIYGLLERFTKCLKDNIGTYIFFNNMKDWEYYKDMILDNHFSIYQTR